MVILLHLFLFLSALCITFFAVHFTYRIAIRRDYALDFSEFKKPLQNASNLHPLMPSAASASSSVLDAKDNAKTASSLAYSLPKTPNQIFEEKKQKVVVETKGAFDDPLADPLAMFASETVSAPSSLVVTGSSAPNPANEHSSSFSSFDDVNRIWRTRRNAILGKFTTSKKISVSVILILSFLWLFDLALTGRR
jgi:hypothetical protein